MVKTTFLGGLVAQALAVFANSRLDTRAENRATYADRTGTAVDTLQKWYNTNTGLWNTAGWWNSGNVLTMLSDFAMLEGDRAKAYKLEEATENTFTNAQKSTPSTRKIRSVGSGMVTSHYEPRRRRGDGGLAARGFTGFINEYYDDEGWWALGWIRAFDVYGTRKYLDMAESIFEDMRKGTDSVCGGGIWWSKEKKYKNAIANELYLAVAASLANRGARARTQKFYRDIATQQWAWLQDSGMINSEGLFNDGLRILSNGTCVNNGENEWSYNQGVVLGGLVELQKATGGGSSSSSSELLDAAADIASAAINKLTNKDGILVDACEPNNCGGDGAQFKGIFVRNLRALSVAMPSNETTQFRQFIFDNADSIWGRDRNETSNVLGLVWAGPPDKGQKPGADTHSSAMDVLVAAIAVASSSSSSSPSATPSTTSSLPQRPMIVGLVDIAR